MNWIMPVVDLVAILVLTFVFYLPRHRRRDLAAALLSINVGILGVSTALASSEVGAGLGLGLFGVLSIIRLRSDQLKQTEIAYYFAALAIGLIGGLGDLPLPIGIGLSAAIVIVLGIVDSPALMRSSDHLVITLDRALSDSEDIKKYVEETTDLTVQEVSITKLDFVQDVTVVDVRGTKLATRKARSCLFQFFLLSIRLPLCQRKRLRLGGIG